jgi:hypothetical protein
VNPVPELPVPHRAGRGARGGNDDGVSVARAAAIPSDAIVHDGADAADAAQHESHADLWR